MDAAIRHRVCACLAFQMSRSGGPGGQHVNKVSTRVTAVLDLEACSALSPAERQRIRCRLGSRCDRRGRLRVTCQDSRSQDTNRRRAVARLLALLERALHRPRVRRATAPTQASRRRRLAAKRQRAQVKQGRRRVHCGDED